MRRREFITLLSGAAAAWPIAARAQQPVMPVIGFLDIRSPDTTVEDRLRAFRQGLKDTGYVERENVAIEYRWAENQIDRLPDLVTELVRRQVAVIVTTSGPAAAFAAKAATTTIPIVFIVAEDPVRLGLVASLARPGGNLTGINLFTIELAAKRLELLRELVPGAARMAVLVTAASAETTVRDVEAAKRALGLQIQVFNVSAIREIDAAFATFARERPDALFVPGDPFLSGRRVQLAQLAAFHRLPATYPLRDYAEAGGLMSYGPSITDAFRQIGVYAGRILKGAKPADLPVVQPMLGLTVPPALLVAADKVIETLLGGAAAAWPLAARAQQAGKVHRIGFLGSATAAGSAKAVESLRAGLREFGYVEGTNIGIEFRWAEGNYDRLLHLVAELIATNVDVLITHGTPGTRVAKEATTTIPIVMAISGDAIATGLVSNLARPEANLTGSTFFLPQLNAKRLELLKEAFPRISRAAALSNPDNPVSRPIIPAMQAAAASLSVIVEVVRAQSPSEFSPAFAAMAKSPVDSVVVTEDGEFAASFREIATLALANKLPSIGAREYAEAGGLIGYGVDILGLYRRAAYFVDRILKGAKPADLPIEQPTKFNLVINLKTAKALGLTVPPTLLARADEVIE